MELKLDKVDETDAIHSWTTQQIDNTRFKIQDFIDWEIKNIKTEVSTKMQQASTIDGIIGNFNETLRYLRS